MVLYMLWRLLYRILHCHVNRETLLLNSIRRLYAIKASYVRLIGIVDPKEYFWGIEYADEGQGPAAGYGDERLDRNRRVLSRQILVERVVVVKAIKYCICMYRVYKTASPVIDKK